MLTLRINNDAKEFSPGQVVAGVVGWELTHPPSEAFLRLVWYTQGRGDQDVNIAEDQELPASQLAVEQAFQFTLPVAPYSFSGALISLQWAIELVLNKGKDSLRIDIVVSPWTEMLKLSSVEMK